MDDTYPGEVVADSEDEGDSLALQMDFDVLPDITNNIKPSGQSEITSFSDKVSAVSSSPFRGCTSSAKVSNDTISSSSSPGPPRPKPRPAYKKKDGTSAIQSSSSNPSPWVPTSGIVDPSQFHMDIPSSIADRAKMRSRNSRTNHSGDRQSNMVVLSEDVIELSTDEDELALLSPARPKPKPKGKGKGSTKSKAKVSSDSPLSSAPESDPKPKASKRSKTSLLLSPHAQSNSQGTIPLPTPIPFHLLSSQLPPSDPPISTATTCDFPPIETLPNIDTDPLSSPSSLFSEPVFVRKKRKRVLQDYEDSIDHKRPEIETDIDVQMMPPPPVPWSLLSQFPSPSADSNHHVTPNDSRENMDILTIHSTADMKVKPVGPPKKSRVTKTRKKKEADNDTENGELRKVDLKGKGKGKKRKKVEVVIQTPANNGKEKEVFKSREFVEDDDDEEYPTLEASNRTTIASNKLCSTTSPDSDREDMLLGPSKQRKSSSSDSMQPGEGKVLAEEKDAPVHKRATRKAKRQSKGLSEDEDEGLVAVSSLGAPKNRSRSVKHAVRKKPNKSRKISNAISDVQSDSEDQAKNSDVDQLLPQAASKDNDEGVPSSETPRSPAKPKKSLFPSLSSQYTIAPKSKSTPMSELIRRVNSQPGSPFPSPKPRVSLISSTGTAYSPYLKSSRSMLSRIAPLHPNRRTPPPPLPPPPPPKKTKKQKEQEEWEDAEEERLKTETESYQYDEED